MKKHGSSEEVGWGTLLRKSDRSRLLGLNYWVKTLRLGL